MESNSTLLAVSMFSEKEALIALFSAGKYVELEQAATESTKKSPQFGFGWKALAAAQKLLGKNPLAAAKRAVDLLPNDNESHNTLGLALSDAGDFHSAVKEFQEAIKINPAYTAAYNNLGNALSNIGQIGRSIDVYRAAIAIAPNFLDCHSGLLCTHNYDPTSERKRVLDDAMVFGAQVRAGVTPYTTWHQPTQRITVGFVSGDLRTHAVACFLLGFLRELRALDHMNLVAYSNSAITDDVTLSLQRHFHLWRDISGVSDKNAAMIIHQDKIDVLIDLSGHTAHSRLPVFAWKPAPIQISWLGYFATTGMAEIDYVLADPWMAPPGSEQDFVESIWRLPETRFCFTPPQEPVDVAPLPAMQSRSLTFGCFGNLTKMNDDVIAVWAKILLAVAGSRLLLKTIQLEDSLVRVDVLARFAAHGIDADRLQFEGRTSKPDYLASYAKVDIVLDTFPFPGGTTTADALWMGVPVLALAGNTFVSRQGVSLLMNARLAHWIAFDKEQFVSLAIKYATDLPMLAALRAILRKQALASPLFDAPRFAMHFEAALREMWAIWCKSNTQ
jgi:predicted O-linked N-acetylglucosamine transferase (SPINDLY family)